MSVRWADALEEIVSVRVRSLDNMDTFTLEVSLTETVASMKVIVSAIAELAPLHQKLIFGRAVLQDDHLLSEYELFAGCLLHLADTRETYIPVAISAGHIIPVRAVPTLRVHVFKDRIKSAVGIHYRASCRLIASARLKEHRRLNDYCMTLPVFCIMRSAFRLEQRRLHAPYSKLHCEAA